MEGINVEGFRLKRNLDELVYEKLMHSIFDGEFQSGEIISIERLCEKYEISRTPVIQAVKRLNSDGIVDVTPTGKFRFPVANEDAVRQVMEVRLRFEAMAAEAVCTSATPEAYIRIIQCAEDCAHYLDCGNSYMASMTDLEFHRQLVAAEGNDYWTDLYQRVQNKCLSLNYLNLNGKSVVSPPAIAQHRQMCEALRDNDAQALIRVVREHIQLVEDQIIENIRLHRQASL